MLSFLAQVSKLIMGVALSMLTIMGGLRLIIEWLLLDTFRTRKAKRMPVKGKLTRADLQRWQDVMRLPKEGRKS